MTKTLNYDRRRFLRNSGILGLGIAVTGITAPYIARAASTQIRIATNPGLENATLSALTGQQDYFREFGVDAVFVEAPGASGPFDAIVAGQADICMVSGYNQVLSRIEQGARVKIVGAGMKKTALTVYAKPDGVRKIPDLKGRTIAVGPSHGLLHALMLQLLKEHEIDASQVNFVDKGSNAKCYQAVKRGEAEACCSSISHMNDKDELVAINGGNMWQGLPKYIFQTAYASDFAIRHKHEGLIAVMAAYGAVYDYLMSPTSHDAFFEARKRAQTKYDKASANAIWDFIQRQRPYSKDLSLTDDEIGYRQDMYIGLGALQQKQPIAAVADMSAARAAAKLLS